VSPSRSTEGLGNGDLVPARVGEGETGSGQGTRASQKEHVHDYPCHTQVGSDGGRITRSNCFLCGS